MMIAGSWTPAALVEANPDLEGKIGAFPIPGPDGGLSPVVPRRLAPAASSTPPRTPTWPSRSCG